MFDDLPDHYKTEEYKNDSHVHRETVDEFAIRIEEMLRPIMHFSSNANHSYQANNRANELRT